MIRRSFWGASGPPRGTVVVPWYPECNENVFSPPPPLNGICVASPKISGKMHTLLREGMSRGGFRIQDTKPCQPFQGERPPRSPHTDTPRTSFYGDRYPMAYCRTLSFPAAMSAFVFSMRISGIMPIPSGHLPSGVVVRVHGNQYIQPFGNCAFMVISPNAP